LSKLLRYVSLYLETWYTIPIIRNIYSLTEYRNSCLRKAVASREYKEKNQDILEAKKESEYKVFRFFFLSDHRKFMF
jgi:hypothetical protein